jgi:hypothetical protein
MHFMKHIIAFAALALIAASAGASTVQDVPLPYALKDTGFGHVSYACKAQYDAALVGDVKVAGNGDVVVKFVGQRDMRPVPKAAPAAEFYSKMKLGDVVCVPRESL